MTANEFVKKFGLDVAKEYLNECPEFCNYLHDGGFYKITENYQVTDRHVLVSDLKRLVESHELVESFGGLEMAKRFLNENIECEDSENLKQAIADVESCQKLEGDK